MQHARPRGNHCPAARRPSRDDLLWAAGFLEGEGSFTYHGRTLRIEAEQNEREPLDRLREMFGGWTISRPRPRMTHRWYAGGARARGVMMTLYSLMFTRRRKQIAEALRGGAS